MINEPYIQWAKTAFALMTLTDYNFLCINKFLACYTSENREREFRTIRFLATDF